MEGKEAGVAGADLGVAATAAAMVVIEGDSGAVGGAAAVVASVACLGVVTVVTVLTEVATGEGMGEGRAEVGQGAMPEEAMGVGATEEGLVGT